MSVVTYEGRIERGQVTLKDAPVLPEGAKVYVVVPAFEGTAFDPMPDEIARDVRSGLDDFVSGHVSEVENGADLAQLVSQIDRL